ncbi:MAG TPA: hypothetical protein VLH41_08610, partial [Thermoanaerobaculia bacterium]|nr:hypothetical protein [Thermoanaerobaculia bacterium]
MWNAVALPLPAGFVNAQSVQDLLQRGYVPEVIDFLTGPSGRSLEVGKSARLLAQAELESGHFADAEAVAGRLL